MSRRVPGAGGGSGPSSMAPGVRSRPSPGGMTLERLWLVLAVALPALVCLLVPIPAVDLAYQVRAGEEILRTGAVPVGGRIHVHGRRDALDGPAVAGPGAAGARFPGRWLGADGGAPRGPRLGLGFGLLAATGAGEGDRPPHGGACSRSRAFALASPALALRPQLVAIAIFALLLLGGPAVAATRASSGSRPCSWSPWANVHGSFVLAPMLLGYAWLDDLVRGAGRAPSRLRPARAGDLPPRSSARSDRALGPTPRGSAAARPSRPGDRMAAHHAVHGALACCSMPRPSGGAGARDPRACLAALAGLAVGLPRCSRSGSGRSAAWPGGRSGPCSCSAACRSALALAVARRSQALERGALAAGVGVPPRRGRGGPARRPRGRRPAMVAARRSHHGPCRDPVLCPVRDRRRAAAPVRRPARACWRPRPGPRSWNGRSGTRPTSWTPASSCSRPTSGRTGPRSRRAARPRTRSSRAERRLAGPPRRARMRPELTAGRAFTRTPTARSWPEPPRPGHETRDLPVYLAAIGISAFLMFVLELLAGRLVLPRVRSVAGRLDHVAVLLHGGGVPWLRLCPPGRRRAAQGGRHGVVVHLSLVTRRPGRSRWCRRRTSDALRTNRCPRRST